MKILWLNNCPMPWIARKNTLASVVGGGWILGTFNEIVKIENIELVILYPQTKSQRSIVDNIDNVKYYGFYKSTNSSIVYDDFWEDEFDTILKAESPDVVHLMGTEYPFTLALLKSVKNNGLSKNAVISIQGLTSVCEKHYLTGLSHKDCGKKTFRDIVKKDGLFKQQSVMKKRGEFEEQSISLVPNVIGRTDWDAACTKFINPTRRYFYNSETLRQEFYTNEHWDVNNVDSHTMFISQATYPIKGFHLAIEALNLVKKTYNDVKLYVGGNNVYNSPKWKMAAYAKIVTNKIHEYNLENNIVFLGPLQANEMKKQYLKSHVFVSSSTVENSPNSMGEAMILGVPCVASDVGGVKNMIEHNKEGFVYPVDEPYMLAYYVMKIFEKDELSMEFSVNARNHALKTHDPDANLKQLLEIYNDIKK